MEAERCETCRNFEEPVGNVSHGLCVLMDPVPEGTPLWENNRGETARQPPVRPDDSCWNHSPVETPDGS